MRRVFPFLLSLNVDCWGLGGRGPRDGLDKPAVARAEAELRRS